MNSITADNVKAALRNHHFDQPAEAHPLLYLNCVGLKLSKSGRPDTPEVRCQTFVAIASQAVWEQLCALRDGSPPESAIPPRERDLAALREDLNASNQPERKALGLLYYFYFTDGRVTVPDVALGAGYSVDYVEKVLRSGRRHLAALLDIIEERATAAATSGDEPRRTNIPPEIVPLVARDHEMAALMRLVPTRRLVTIVGAPGVGKTSLALAYGRRANASFPGGGYFVDLTTIGDGSEATLLNAIATVIGASEAGRAGLHSAIVESLQQRAGTLLVLDNFEHVAESATALVGLLRDAPALYVLATSREPLNLSLEQLLPLAPWEVPAVAGDEASFRAWRDNPAMQYFELRARMVLPDFSVSASNGALVAEICGRLDGLPLAIDLAVRHLGRISLADLGAALEARLDILAGGARDLPQRMRSMEAAIGFSYERLSRQERRALEVVAAFASAFERDLALDVLRTSIGDGADGDILDTLQRKSLVEGAGAGRLRLLQAIREFAVARAERRGWREELTALHRQTLLSAAETHARGLAIDATHAWLDGLSGIYPDLRLILQRAEDAGDVATLGRCIAALWRYWKETGQLSEARRWIDATLRLVGDDVPGDPIWIEVFKGAASIAHYQGDVDVAVVALETSLRLARMAGDDLEVAAALGNGGMFLHYLGRVADAEPQFDDAVAILRRIDPPHPLKLAAALNSRADLFRDCGRHVEADRDFTEAQELVKPINALWSVGMAFNRGAVAVVRGDLQAARAIGMSSRQAFRELGSPLNEALVCSFLAMIELQRAHLDAAREWVRAAEAINAVVNDRWQVAGNHLLLSQIALAEGDVASAEAHVATCRSIYVELQYPFGILSSEIEVAKILCAKGDTGAGLELLRQCFANARRLDARRQLCSILQAAGVIVSRQGHHRRALDLIACAEALQERLGIRLPPIEQDARKAVVAKGRAELGVSAALPNHEGDADAVVLDVACGLLAQPD